MGKESFIWEISASPYQSEFLRESIQFGTSNPIFLVDQFGGKRPAIFNKEFIEQGSIQFGMYPSALLDSNIIDQLDRFVLKGHTTDGFICFLRFLSQRRWDSSPIFYYLEHFSKSSLDDFRKNAVRRTESLLKVHSMNDSHFIETGQLIADEKAVAHYFSTSGATSLKEVAEKRVERFIQRHSKATLLSMIEAIEIALLKMVLIRKFEYNGASPAQQYREFMRFLKNDLGMLLGREAHLAIHYFCDNAGRLLGIQPNTPKEKAKSIIKSTAWDMYLLRLPEIMFSESPSEVCISYVATQEKQLQKLAQLFSIERIECFRKIGLTPTVGFSTSGLPQKVIDEIKYELHPIGDQKTKGVPTGLNQALFNQLERFCA